MARKKVSRILCYGKFWKVKRCQKKRKIPEVNTKKFFLYDLVIDWWEDIVGDSNWV